MNCQKIYDALVQRGVNRIIDDFTETHHILPKCMGGSDEPTNLVELTPEEHYLAHQLLCKIYPNNYGLAIAASIMSRNRPTNKLYGWIRRKHAIAMSKIQTGSGNSQYGMCWIYNIQTLESKKIMKTSPIPNGWKKGRKLKLVTDRESHRSAAKLKKEQNKIRLREIMHYYRDNEISMRELSKKFNVGHNVYVSFERFFKEEYRDIVKTKKGNSNCSKGRY